MSKRDNLIHLLWLRPHTGVLCFGPPGPPLEFSRIVHPFVRLDRFIVERPPPDDHLKLPPLPLNMCNDTVFLEYLMHNVPEQHVVTVVSALNSDRVTGPTHRKRGFWKEHLMTGQPNFWADWGDNFARRVLKIPFHRWTGNVTCSYAGSENLGQFYKFLDNGGLRSVCVPDHLALQDLPLWRSRTLHTPLARSVGSHKPGGFSAVWEFLEQSIISGFTLDLTPEIQTPLELEDWDEPVDPPCYLFVPPYPRLPDDLPDIETWLRGENLYYYSYDPEGGSAITEEERISLRLPSWTSGIYTNYSRWDANTYDFMEQWQKAKGFDYTTTDYATSWGFPILEVIPQDECRFENLMGFSCEDEGKAPPLSSTPKTLTRNIASKCSSEILGADSMDVDSEFETTRDDGDILSSDVDMGTEN
ncbi:hypothetical protein PQX77_013988 [Marasmius sp. AFHP31]|nr:hypothetical protein PQX77_013988 [Marasmius sp. AFHP31]